MSTAATVTPAISPAGAAGLRANQRAAAAAKAAVVWPEGNDEPLGRGTIMATAAFTSQGRGRMSRGLMVKFVTTAPSATATSTPAPALRVRRKHSSTRPRRIHSSPWLLVLVKTATSGSSTGLCHACMASSMASSFTGLPSFPHSLPESVAEGNSPLPAAARFPSVPSGFPYPNGAATVRLRPATEWRPHL